MYIAIPTRNTALNIRKILKSHERSITLCLLLNRRWRTISIFLDERLRVLSLDYARVQNASKHITYLKP